MSRLKKFLTLMLSVFMFISLISCSGRENSEKIKIRFATWDNAEDLVSQQKMVDEFNKIQDKIEVVIEAYGANYDTKITASMGSGDAPDVMYMWNYPKYANGLLPLDDMISKEGTDFYNNYYEALWNYNSFDGKKLGMPVGYTTHVLYYNKDLFDSAGIPYPTDNWTWKDVYEASYKISDLKNKIYGIAFPIKPDPYDYEMFTWSNDSSYASKSGEVKGYLNSSKTIQVFEFFQNMIKKNIAISVKDSGEKNFLLGKVAMFVNGSWSLNRLNEKGINYGVALLPKFTSEPAKSIINSSGLSISKTTKYPNEAWEFVKYWTGEEMNKNRIDYEFPVLKSVVEETGIINDPIKIKFYKMLEQSEGMTPSSFIVKDWTTLSDKIELSLEKILNKNSLSNPKEVLNEAVK